MPYSIAILEILIPKCENQEKERATKKVAIQQQALIPHFLSRLWILNKLVRVRHMYKVNRA